MVANLGLIFYMFLVGLEIDPSQLKGRVAQAAAISNASVALPMMLGIAVALPVYELVGPDTKFVAFALFMGVAMSITAFPVLARILVERRMLKRPVGALTLACAAIDDVTAWFLIALATAVAVAGIGSEVVVTIALAVVFCLVMGFVRAAAAGARLEAYDEAGRVPSGWIVAIFAGVLLSAYTTETIGIALIFGAFIMGMIMPRHAELTEDVTRRIEDFVVTLLLPLFFAFTGLRTNVGLLDRPELWLLTGVLIAGGDRRQARRRDARGAAHRLRLALLAAVIGTLMNTRGLTELIVLNLALETGVISEALFAVLVLMALVTTFMAGPLLKLLDPKNEFGAPVEEELDEARTRVAEPSSPTLEVPERSILRGAADRGGARPARAARRAARALGAAARADPRAAWCARRAARPCAAACRRENKLLAETSATRSHAARNELIEERHRRPRRWRSSRPTPAPTSHAWPTARRSTSCSSTARGRCWARESRVASVGEVLEDAPCDVAVLVAHEDEPVQPGARRPGDRALRRRRARLGGARARAPGSPRRPARR